MDKQPDSGMYIFCIYCKNVWNKFSRHYPRLSRWIAHWNGAGLMLAGVGIEEAHEYSIALGLLIAGAISVTFSAIHWTGIDGFPRLTKYMRVIIFVFGVACLPLSLMWILNAQGENPWSRLHLPSQWTTITENKTSKKLATQETKTTMLSTASSSTSTNALHVDRDGQPKNHRHVLKSNPTISMATSTINGGKKRSHIYFTEKKIILPEKDSDPIRILFTVINDGDDDVLVTFKDSTVAFITDPTPTIFNYLPAPFREYFIHPTTTLGGKAEAYMRFNYQLTPKMLNLIKDGKAYLYFYSRSEFKDSVGKVYPLRWAYMYDPLLPGNVADVPNDVIFK